LPKFVAAALGSGETAKASVFVISTFSVSPKV